MTSQQQNNVPKKGQIIINPKTSRPVRIGSRTWLRLVKEGIVSGEFTDPNELAELPEKYEELPPPEQERVIEEQIKEVNKNLPRGQHAVRGRGKYKGKIVSRNKQLPTEQVSKYTAQIATRAVANNIDRLAECEDDDDIEGMLEKLILAEMMGGNSKPKRTGSFKSSLKNPISNTRTKYEEVEPEEYDYEEANDCSSYEDENWEY